MREASRYKGLVLKIVIVWSGILLLVGFLIASMSSANHITLSVIPEVPKTGEPVVATFNISNPSDRPLTSSYELYVNGKLVESGNTTIAPFSSSKYQYAHKNYLQRGEQVNFMLRTSSDRGSFDKIVSLPAYPSQLMSSFVSFAAFSTSVMSSMLSMEYFSGTFGTTSGLNIGILVSIVLISLLVFLQLTQTISTGKGITILGSYKTNFRTVSSILFIIFVGMVFTKVVMIIAT